MIQSLFVYGTLRLGQPNANVMERIGGVWKKGVVWGELEHKGWGAAMGSPGIRLSKAGQAIEGYVFISENLAAHWAALDEFEGAEYQRVAVDVQLEGGEWMQSEIYALK
nr:MULTISPECIES: gamma-glutamylcyclotransferase family protein [unclassified Acinetobacter]